MNFKIQSFTIKIPYAGKRYKAIVEQTYLSENKEIFTITGGSKSIQIQSNRPFVKADSLSKKKVTWKALNCTLEQKEFFEIVIEEIDRHLHTLSHPPFDWSEHPKNAGNKKAL